MGLVAGAAGGVAAGARAPVLAEGAPWRGSLCVRSLCCCLPHCLVRLHCRIHTGIGRRKARGHWAWRRSWGSRPPAGSSRHRLAGSPWLEAWAREPPQVSASASVDLLVLEGWKGRPASGRCVCVGVFLTPGRDRSGYGLPAARTCVDCARVCPGRGLRCFLPTPRPRHSQHSHQPWRPDLIQADTAPQGGGSVLRTASAPEAGYRPRVVRAPTAPPQAWVISPGGSPSWKRLGLPVPLPGGSTWSWLCPAARGRSCSPPAPVPPSS